MKKSSMLAYMSRPYSEAMAMCPDVTYKPYATSSKEQTGNIIMFSQFEDGGLLYYLKLVTIRKAVKNPMTIQLCHH